MASSFDTIKTVGGIYQERNRRPTPVRGFVLALDDVTAVFYGRSSRIDSRGHVDPNQRILALQREYMPWAGVSVGLLPLSLKAIGPYNG